MEFVLAIIGLVIVLIIMPRTEKVADKTFVDPAIERHDPFGCGAGILLVCLVGCVGMIFLLAAAMETTTEGAGVELLRRLVTGG